MNRSIKGKDTLNIQLCVEGYKMPLQNKGLLKDDRSNLFDSLQQSLQYQSTNAQTLCVK